MTATHDRPVRILVADDHVVARRGIAAMLASLDGIELAAEAADGAQAVKEALLTRPDVAIMDIQMPVMDGIEATRRLTTQLPGIVVLVLTMFDDDDNVVAALRAGARGYLLKGASQDEFAAAIKAVLTGQVVIGPGIADRLATLLGPVQSGGQVFPQLTVREHEILERIARGENNSTIAAGLGVAVKTVHNNVSTIIGKLQVSTRAEALIRAREQGLGTAHRDGAP